MNLTPDHLDELARRARRLIDAHRYLTLSTSDADGLPWVTPVYFTPDGHRRFLWLSSPEARHSANVAARPDVAIVMFDSTVPIGGAEAVYFRARAGRVADEHVDVAGATFARRFPEVAEYGPAEMRPPSPLRLYEAVVTECSVLVRGGDPRNPAGVDGRVVVDL